MPKAATKRSTASWMPSDSGLLTGRCNLSEAATFYWLNGRSQCPLMLRGSAWCGTKITMVASSVSGEVSEDGTHVV